MRITFILVVGAVAVLCFPVLTPAQALFKTDSGPARKARTVKDVQEW